MKKISLNTLITAFILLNTISLTVHADTVSDQVTACNNALEKGDYTTASTTAEAILKSDANHRGGLLCQGRALGSLGKYNEALAALNKALKYSQAGLEQIFATIFIGNLHHKNQQIAEAIASYQASLNLSLADKNDKFVRINHNFIGNMHTQNKDLNAALASYMAGSKLSMNDNERAESYEYLAATYRALAQLDLAVEHQLKATMMQQKAGTLDDYANASFVLGQTYLEASEYDAAERTFNKLLKFSKENGGTYYEAKANYGLAQTSVAKNAKDQAKAFYTEALKLAKASQENALAAEIEAGLNSIKP